MYSKFDFCSLISSANSWVNAQLVCWPRLRCLSIIILISLYSGFTSVRRQSLPVTRSGDVRGVQKIIVVKGATVNDSLFFLNVRKNKMFQSSDHSNGQFKLNKLFSSKPVPNTNASCHPPSCSASDCCCRYRPGLNFPSPSPLVRYSPHRRRRVLPVSAWRLPFPPHVSCAIWYADSGTTPGTEQR